MKEDYEKMATRIMMNALEGVKAQIRKAYDKGYKDGQKSLVNAYVAGKGEDTLEDIKKAEYNRGLNDVWEVIQKITRDDSVGGYSIEMMQTLFGQTYVYDIIHNYEPREALAKIKEYEDKQKQDAEIKVGDEVVYCDGIKGIVVGISNTAGQISVLNNKYDVPQLLVKNRAKKTGRTFPQIAEVLAELRGEENDE